MIAVIRSTGQSLLDYVPEGATREGYAAFHTAEILSKEADRRKIELAARTERYNTQLERQNAALVATEPAAA